MEFIQHIMADEEILVAPRMGSVGWNAFFVLQAMKSSLVAPRMGSVGWNNYGETGKVIVRVAPRMGSVGWNPWDIAKKHGCGTSLPVWGAWVGIFLRLHCLASPSMSLPVWGAWVGILRAI